MKQLNLFKKVFTNMNPADSTLKILWGVMVLETLACLVVSVLIQQQIIPFQSVLNNQTGLILFYVLAGISLLLLIGQEILLRKRPSLKAVLPEQIDPLQKKRFTYHLIAMAFGNAVVVYGLVLFLATGFLVPCFTMMGIGALALIRAFPKPESDV